MNDSEWWKIPRRYVPLRAFRFLPQFDAPFRFLRSPAAMSIQISQRRELVFLKPPNTPAVSLAFGPPQRYAPLSRPHLGLGADRSSDRSSDPASLAVAVSLPCRPGLAYFYFCLVSSCFFLFFKAAAWEREQDERALLGRLEAEGEALAQAERAGRVAEGRAREAVEERERLNVKVCDHVWSVFEASSAAVRR